MVVATGATVGNVAISVSGTGKFAPQPGSGTLSIGATGAGSGGATLSLASGSTFSMADGAIGTFNLQQQNSFAGNPALSLSGGTLVFDLGSKRRRRFERGAGTASVSGTNTISVAAIGSPLTAGTYPLINAPAGGLSGTFQFAGGGTSQFLLAGTSSYQLTLNNTSKAVSVTVAPASFTYIINDTFNSPAAAPRTPAICRT